jgi:catechol 2,3-dioxygenase-like lactoylglutathione lyase family enzyme
MTTTIAPVRLNHMNLVLESAEAGLAHMRTIYDAELVADVPKAEYHAFLFATGSVLFEAFCPAVWLLGARYGPHVVGVEYQADMATVVAAVAERGMRIIRESRYERDLAGNPGYALHTHPADGFGVSYEFYHDDFHTWNWPELGGRIRPVADWAGHPLGHAGQWGYTHVVADIDAASAFLQGFLSAKPVYEAERPEIGGRALGLRIADVTVELQTPTGPGELARHHYRYGDGIRSTVFAVRSVAAARAHLAARGLPIVPGSLPGAVAVPAEANQGVIFEFVERG